MAATVRGCHPETTADIPMVSRKERNVTNTTNSSNQPGGSAALPPANLATLLAALEGQSGLSESRRRDLRSAVKRVAHLLGNAPAAIPLAMDAIRDGLSAVNPIAVGMTPKRFANIRSDFVAAVKASGLAPGEDRKQGGLKPGMAPALCTPFRKAGQSRAFPLGPLRQRERHPARRKSTTKSSMGSWPQSARVRFTRTPRPFIAR